jgi:hypothetical protein
MFEALLIAAFCYLVSTDLWAFVPLGTFYCGHSVYLSLADCCSLVPNSE